MSDTVAPMLDAGGTRVVAYLLVAALAATWYVRERRALGHAATDTRSDSERDGGLWPTYWLLTAMVLAAMAVGRSVVGDTVVEIGREQARSSGWYGDRRDLQIAGCAAVTALWFVVVALAIWRVRARRRRYLPSVASISALAAFAAVRVVSLHQIDTVLYRRGIGGVRYVAIIELSLLTIAALTIVADRIGRATVDEYGSPSTGQLAAARGGDDA